MTVTFKVDRYLPNPGLSPTQRGIELCVSSKAVTATASEGGTGLALPALINAHDHGYGVRTIGFGGVDDILEVWASSLVLRPDVDPYLKALVAFGRLAEGGVASTVHCHNAQTAENLVDQAASVVKAAKTVGIKLALSCPLIDANPWVYDGPTALRPFMSSGDWDELSKTIPSYRSPEEQIAVVDLIADNHHGGDIDIQYGPIGPQWCSEKLLGLIADASQRTGRRVHMHLLESIRQRQWLDHKYPNGIIHHLDSIGLLSPRLAVAHGVQLRPDECELLAARGVVVVSNPSANLRLRSGIAPISDFLGKNLRFAIGLDGTGFDDDQDLWREARLIYLLHGGSGVDRTLSAHEVFNAAINVGRDVVNCPNSSDLAVIDYEALTRDSLFQDIDETEVILTRMTRRYVRDLIVSGNWVVRDGKLANIDLDEAETELHAQASIYAGQNDFKRDLVRRLQDAIRRFYKDVPIDR